MVIAERLDDLLLSSGEVYGAHLDDTLVNRLCRSILCNSEYHSSAWAPIPTERLDFILQTAAHSCIEAIESDCWFHTAVSKIITTIVWKFRKKISEDTCRKVQQLFEKLAVFQDGLYFYFFIDCISYILPHISTMESAKVYENMFTPTTLEALISHFTVPQVLFLERVLMKTLSLSCLTNNHIVIYSLCTKDGLSPQGVTLMLTVDNLAKQLNVSVPSTVSVSMTKEAIQHRLSVITCKGELVNLLYLLCISSYQPQVSNLTEHPEEFLKELEKPSNLYTSLLSLHLFEGNDVSGTLWEFVVSSWTSSFIQAIQSQSVSELHNVIRPLLSQSCDFSPAIVKASPTDLLQLCLDAIACSAASDQLSAYRILLLRFLCIIVNRETNQSQLMKVFNLLSSGIWLQLNVVDDAEVQHALKMMLHTCKLLLPKAANDVWHYYQSLATVAVTECSTLDSVPYSYTHSLLMLTKLLISHGLEQRKSAAISMLLNISFTLMRSLDCCRGQLSCSTMMYIPVGAVLQTCLSLFQPTTTFYEDQIQMFLRSLSLGDLFSNNAEVRGLLLLGLLACLPSASFHKACVEVVKAEDVAVADWLTEKVTGLCGVDASELTEAAFFCEHLRKYWRQLITNVDMQNRTYYHSLVDLLRDRFAGVPGISLSSVEDDSVCEMCPECGESIMTLIDDIQTAGKFCDEVDCIGD